MNHTVNVYRIAFLLEGGEKFIEEENTQSFLETLTEIGIKVRDFPTVTANINLLPVDPVATNLSEFLFYEDMAPEDIIPENLIWRSYFYFEDAVTHEDFLGTRVNDAVYGCCDAALKVWNDIHL